MLRRWIVILAVSGACFTWGLFYGPAARQRRGLDAAHAFLEQIEPKLTADPRFFQIRSRLGTNVVLLFHGDLPDEQAKQDLMAITAAPEGAKFKVQLRVEVVPFSVIKPAN